MAIPNRREVPRYVCELNAQVVQPESGSRQDATVTVLSVKGCCLEGVGPLDRGQKCFVNTEWCGRDLLAEAEVIWKNQGRAGCRFTSVSDDAMGTIRQVLAGLPLQPLRSMAAAGAD